MSAEILMILTGVALAFFFGFAIGWMAGRSEGYIRGVIEVTEHFKRRSSK